MGIFVILQSDSNNNGNASDIYIYSNTHSAGLDSD